MMVEVRLFARLADVAGTGVLKVDLPAGATVADLRKSILQTCEARGAKLPPLHIAVGQNYANDDVVIPAHAEIACFPPVSGG